MMPVLVRYLILCVGHELLVVGWYFIIYLSIPYQFSHIQRLYYFILFVHVCAGKQEHNLFKFFFLSEIGFLVLTGTPLAGIHLALPLSVRRTSMCTTVLSFRHDSLDGVEVLMPCNKHLTHRTIYLSNLRFKDCRLILYYLKPLSAIGNRNESIFISQSEAFTASRPLWSQHRLCALFDQTWWP